LAASISDEGIGDANESTSNAIPRDTGSNQVHPISTQLDLRLRGRACAPLAAVLLYTDRRHARPLLEGWLASDVARLRQIGAI